MFGTNGQQQEVIEALKAMGVQGMGFGISFEEMEALKNVARNEERIQNLQRRMNDAVDRIAELEDKLDEMQEHLEGPVIEDDDEDDDDEDMTYEPQVLFAPFPANYPVRWQHGQGPNRWRGDIRLAPTFIKEDGKVWVIYRTDRGVECHEATETEMQWFNSVSMRGLQDEVIEMAWARR